jgi:hypothetical protein
MPRTPPHPGRKTSLLDHHVIARIATCATSLAVSVSSACTQRSPGAPRLLAKNKSIFENLFCQKKLKNRRKEGAVYRSMTSWSRMVVDAYNRPANIDWCEANYATLDWVVGGLHTLPGGVISVTWTIPAVTNRMSECVLTHSNNNNVVKSAPTLLDGRGLEHRELHPHVVHRPVRWGAVQLESRLPIA